MPHLLPVLLSNAPPVPPAPQTGQEYDEEGLRRTVEEQVKTAQVMTWLQQNIKVTIQPWQGEGQQAAAAAASS